MVIVDMSGVMITKRQGRPGKALALLCALVAVAVLCGASRTQAADPLVLGVHPYLPTQEILNRFEPLATYLERHIGQPVRVSVSADYDVHLGHVALGTVDFGYLGPASYVALTAKYGAHPLLARMEIEGVPTFHGYIVVRQDDPARTVGDLRHRRFAFGDVRSTMSHVVPYALLLDAGVTKEDLAGFDFVGSHKNVALSVLTGTFDAGGVKEEVYQTFKTQGLRALAKSPPVSEHLFVAAKAMPADTVAALRNALMGLHDTDAGRKILAGIKKTATGLVAVSDADYAPLRDMITRVEASP